MIRISRLQYMQSLFNKRNKSEAGLSDLFSQPPTNIIQVEKPQPQFPANTLSEPIDQEPENIQETEEQREEKLSRTIFIGNVKIDTNKKQVKRLLETYGKVEKVWYRSVPVEQSKIGPKASFILKKFQEDADSMNAYARFEHKQSLGAALELNGIIFNGLTIRVTAADSKQMDFQRTVFIGNLPFDVKQEELRQFCSKVGVIENVRVIRNKFTHKGIGIAYVMFDSQQTMKNAIKELSGKVFKERAIRVKKAVEKKRLDKKRNKFIDPKEVNKNAALKRIEERNKEARKNQRKEKNQERVSSSPAPNKPSQPKTQNSAPKPATIQPTKSLPKQNEKKFQKVEKSPKPGQKKTPLNQKKKPHVSTQMDEEDKNLSNEVTEQLKLLKRKMISKKK